MKPQAKTAKAKNKSAALKEATGAASKEVRSPSSSPEDSHGEHASRKSPDAPPDEGDNPRFSYEQRSPRQDWDWPEFSCTKVVYSGESSQEEEGTSECSAQAANDKKQAEGDVPNAPADPDTQAEEPTSGKTGPGPWQLRRSRT
ncbi:uncharacterized protein IUM83_02781 [Phytophthora cinnamomi]|uniref:uncharacterized protein n=1 Tax=Phytophthora cinnamomi TaxID=4785 RepID=UPI003559AF05|nr:hypothetical protein IUM83_02781 [Phytophthora cinnamomi]